MGFMDKAREAAQQATAKAQQGIAQGQAKIDDVQTSRAADGLLREVGAAFYAEQRSGGSHEAVVAALGAVDAHVAAHGPLGQAGQTGQGSTEAKPQSSAQPGTPAGSPGGTPPAEPSADPPASGGFTLDDL
jgi:hypothetical protein